MLKFFNSMFAGTALVCFAIVGVAYAESSPDIASRSEWQAPSPILKRLPPIREVTKGDNKVLSENVLNPRPVDQLEFLTIHSTSIPRPSVPNISGKMNSLRKMVQKGYFIGSLKSYMAEIPYHYVILRDGEVDGKIVEGRELKFPAATNTRNSSYGREIAKHLTIVVEIKYAKKNGKLVDLPPTKAQLDSLRSLVEHLAKKHKISAQQIGFHKQYASTACPGPALISETNKIRNLLVQKGL